MSKAFFITATGTEIGKTFTLEKLCAEFSKNKKSFTAIKPLISGFDINDLENDSAKILRILNKQINEKNLNGISPWRFKAPLSPNIAAALENRKLNFEELVNFCQNKIISAKKNDQYLLIEGAGGAMTPVNDNKTFCDLIAALNVPTILVMGDYLGCISHCLTAIRAMESYKINIVKIIINRRTHDIANLESIVKTLQNFTNIEIETDRLKL